MKFEVGQQVVCIANGTWQRTVATFPGTKAPLKGNVYTIREIYQDPWSGDVGIRFFELMNPHYKLDGKIIEPGWMPKEFRAVKPTNIDVLEQIALNCPAELIQDPKESIIGLIKKKFIKGKA